MEKFNKSDFTAIIAEIEFLHQYRDENPMDRMRFDSVIKRLNNLMIVEAEALLNKVPASVIKEKMVESKPSSSKKKKKKWVRYNTGFYKLLSTFLTSLRKQNITSITRDKCYDFMVKRYPSINDRIFNIYLSDKRRWPSPGYTYDGINKIIQIVTPIRKIRKKKSH